MLSRWTTLSSRILHSNPWWKYFLDSFQTGNGHVGEYHYVHTEGASMVIPITADGRIVLVNQYRYLCQRDSVELPCGGVKPEHSYEETARHELEEETGYRSGHMECVGEFNPFNGVTDEICKVFIARELALHTPKPDATEEFEILSVLPKELDAMIVRGEIWDGMTLAAWVLARPHLKT
ncbi:MAG: NUDIX hydrolase [Ignavibacteriales bacterium]|nr:NUDIX hydrolase [Ignavibacteriales bacterium]